MFMICLKFPSDLWVCLFSSLYHTPQAFLMSLEIVGCLSTVVSETLQHWLAAPVFGGRGLLSVGFTVGQLDSRTAFLFLT